HRVARLEAGVAKSCDRERGVPDRGLARLEGPPAIVLDSEAVEAFEPRPHGRVVEGVALQAQGYQGVDPGRLDAAPGAVGLLALDDPPLGPPERGPPEPLDRTALVGLQEAV